MAKIVNYSEKLRDPRWQKKRLDILNRDKFTCVSCSETTKTLNVHHHLYSGEPWDVEDKYLVTLCEKCHEYETKNRKKAEEELLLSLKHSGFLADSVFELGAAFMQIKMTHLPEVVSSIIEMALTDEDIMIALENIYFEKIQGKQKNG